MRQPNHQTINQSEKKFPLFYSFGNDAKVHEAQDVTAPVPRYGSRAEPGSRTPCSAREFTNELSSCSWTHDHERAEQDPSRSPSEPNRPAASRTRAEQV